MKYYGSWSVNGGQTFNTSYSSNNKKELRKELIQDCDGNLTGPTSTGGWSIVDEKGNMIDQGTCRW